MRRTALVLTILTAAAMTCAAARAADEPIPLLEDPATALVLIDIQDFYFPGGAVPLVEPEAAATHAGRVLAAFREHERLVIHVGHQIQAGGDFHAAVAPAAGEEIVMKTEVNAFHGTDLHELLQSRNIRRLVLVGMQTHMCLEGATRAAADLGYECTVIADACATRDLKRGDSVIEAIAVHQATLATLDRVYATVLDTDDFLD